MRTTVRQRPGDHPRPNQGAVHLEVGDPVEFEIVEDGILLKPHKVIDSTQAWFWTASWQAGEREAAEERAAGRGRVFESSDEFLASLDE